MELGYNFINSGRWGSWVGHILGLSIMGTLWERDNPLERILFYCDFFLILQFVCINNCACVWDPNIISVAPIPVLAYCIDIIIFHLSYWRHWQCDMFQAVQWDQLFQESNVFFLFCGDLCLTMSRNGNACLSSDWILSFGSMEIKENSQFIVKPLA